MLSTKNCPINTAPILMEDSTVLQMQNGGAHMMTTVEVCMTQVAMKARTIFICATLDMTSAIRPRVAAFMLKQVFHTI